MSFLKILQNFDHIRSPYIFYDENGKAFMYFINTQKEMDKLYFTDGEIVKEVEYISTFNITHISCYKNFKTGKYCVSFCSKNRDTNTLYYTQTEDPTDFKIIDSITSQCKCGIVTPRYIIISTLSNFIFLYKNNLSNKTGGNLLDNLSKQAFFFNMKNIINISSINQEDNKILVNYLNPDTNQYGTVLINLSDVNQQYMILTDTQFPIFDATVDYSTQQILFKNEWKVYTSLKLDKIIKKPIQLIQKK